MTRATTTRWMAALRLLVAVGCLVPFVGPRQVVAAFGVTPVLPPAPLPFAPVNEEDESQREESAKEVAHLRPDRHVGHRAARDRLSTADPRGAARARNPVSRPAPADPFRNGLGAHYRC